jgi:hypothetical protein
MPLSPLIRFGTSTWTYEGWQGQVYLQKYAKTTFARECLGEYCQYLTTATRAFARLATTRHSIGRRPRINFGTI